MIETQRSWREYWEDTRRAVACGRDPPGTSGDGWAVVGGQHPDSATGMRRRIRMTFWSGRRTESPTMRQHSDAVHPRTRSCADVVEVAIGRELQRGIELQYLELGLGQQLVDQRSTAADAGEARVNFVASAPGAVIRPPEARGLTLELSPASRVPGYECAKPASRCERSFEQKVIPCWKMHFWALTNLWWNAGRE